MSAFTDSLRRVAQRVEGTRTVSLIGADGIPVETHGDVEGLSIETVAAEMGNLLRAARNASVAAGTGEIRELAALTETSITVLSRVTEEYYLLLLLARGGNLGRGRFELAKAAATLEKELL